MSERMSENDTLKQEYELVITRVFNAPRDLVFKLWTQAEHLQHWWGPKGSKLNVSKLDLRPGGIFHYSMSFPEGHMMWGKFVYREIVQPEKLVFVNSFADGEGNIIRAPFDAPFSATYPLEVLNTVTLIENEGKTTMTLRGEPINATDEERMTYKSLFESMQQGFGGTFDKLSDYLEEVR